MPPKIVGYLICKNEAWIIGETLANLSSFCDEIVVVDDNSRDETVDIARSFPKVTELVCHRRKVRKEVSNFNQGLRLAQSKGADWLLKIDADEIFSANIRDHARKLVESAPPEVGDLGFLQVNPWRGRDVIRVDRPYRFVRWVSHRLVRNVPSLQWLASTPKWWRRWIKYAVGLERWWGGEPHSFGLSGVRGKTMCVEGVYLLHMNWTNWERLTKKHMQYTYEIMYRFPKRDLFELIDRQWSEIFDETGLETYPSDQAWFKEGYDELQDRGETEEERSERELRWRHLVKLANKGKD